MRDPDPVAQRDVGVVVPRQDHLVATLRLQQALDLERHRQGDRLLLDALCPDAARVDAAMARVEHDDGLLLLRPWRGWRHHGHGDRGSGRRDGPRSVGPRALCGRCRWRCYRWCCGRRCWDRGSDRRRSGLHACGGCHVDHHAKGGIATLRRQRELVGYGEGPGEIDDEPRLSVVEPAVALPRDEAAGLGQGAVLDVPAHLGQIDDEARRCRQHHRREVRPVCRARPRCACARRARRSGGPRPAAACPRRQARARRGRAARGERGPGMSRRGTATASRARGRANARPYPTTIRRSSCGEPKPFH